MTGALAPRASLLLLLVAVGCAGSRDSTGRNYSVVDGLGVRGVVLEGLLASPTESELTQVRSDWSSREIVAEDVRVEARFDLPSNQVLLVVSHRTPAGRHVGGVLAPVAALDEAASHPVLLQLHGLGPEMTLELPDPAAAPSGTPPTEIVTAWPSFAGHSLRFRDQTWSSDGEPWDFCDGAGDDALRFLEATLQVVSGADPGRVVAYGGSRGGNVALLLALRDTRIRRAISLAGPTDYFVEDLLSHENAFVLYGQWLVKPVLEGTGTVADARARLLRCSPLYFAEHLPPVQLHHGTADRNLPVEQTRKLEHALRPWPRGYDQIYYYEGGDHQLADRLTELRERVRAFVGPVFDAE